jgi:hypothetical protein
LEKKEKKKKSCGDFREGDPWYLDGEFVQRGLRHGFGRPHLFPLPDGGSPPEFLVDFY